LSVWKPSRQRALAVVALVCAGCFERSIKAYSGADQPSARLAVLRVMGGAVESVDGSTDLACKDLVCVYEFLPGEHSLSVSLDTKGIRSKEARRVPVMLEAAHEYSLFAHASSTLDDWCVTVMNHTTRRVVHTDLEQHCR
jgi:hypothetical protein